VNQLHDAGLSGAGVFVCMLDTGFLRTHQALDQVNVIAERDFIHGDNVTSNQPGDDPNQHNHGTYCLSICGGFDPGNLIGPAYGASFLLGKTEEITSETPVEEDFWIAGAEWADSLGADVISSSLTYSDWYVYDDMDGDTAPITIAADLATLNGIVVCNSAGNLGDDPWFYIAAPADGDSVIAVGAVDSLGVITGFSSRGPTSDGRTKPDVCAMGSGNIFASMFSPSSYSRGSGTSFSCPLVAGVAALLLQAHPGWTPMQVRDALRLTATNAATPNNDYGWGIIRGWNANQWGGTAAPEIEPAAGVAGFFASPNPSRGLTILRADLAPGETIRAIAIHDARGRLVRDLEGSTWDGRNDDGSSAPAGIYFARMVTNRGTATARIVRLH
jgi:subtilisin family serine protease